MCGIAAIFSPEPDPALHARAERMLDLLRHRGPDDAHVVGFGPGDPADRPAAPGDPVTVALAVNRLAIQDLSPAGRMPMADPTGRWWIAYNGEIYNFLELRPELERAGPPFRSRGDTEVLLRLLARDGVRALRQLDGMFAFLLYDRVTGQVTAVRDRFGIKPLYYHVEADGSLAFASEIKAFTAGAGWRATLEPARARDYLARGLVDHTPQTMFAGVRQVPPGHLVTFDAGAPPATLAPERWFGLEPHRPPDPSESWPGRMRELLAQSVTRRLRADVDVGSCLSGGLDSSAIVCLAAEARRAAATETEQLTFTARGRDPDEWPFATMAARHAGARPIAVSPRAEGLLAELDDLVWTQDEPFASPSIYAQSAVFRAAREHGVTVMLDGQGADEQLAGYHIFFRSHLHELLRRGRWGEAGRVVRARRRVHGLPVAGQLAKALELVVPGALARRLRPGGLVNTVVDAERLAAGWRDPYLGMPGRRGGVPGLSIDLLTAGSLPPLLHWEDRNSMAHSVEARVPFLCPAVVGFVLGLPSAAKLDGATTKVILREAMAGRVPDAILERTDKVAFATPDAAWLGPEHAERVHPVLAAAIDAAGGIIRTDGAALLRAMVDGRRPYDPILWRVICFGAWRRRFGVGDR
jgi:asparagine synthase (glutamine-hydrolysing)